MGDAQKKYWKHGDQIVIREVSKKKVWTVRPVTVIKDSKEMIVFYMCPGTVIKHPRELYSEEVPHHLIANEWRLIDKTWFGGGALYVSIPNEPYMIIGFRNDENTEFTRWYINIQDPLTRNQLGFDYLDMELDVEVDKELLLWKWKDMDKLNDLVEKDIIAKTKANHLIEVGEDIAKRVVSKKSIIENWRNWNPEVSYPVPIIPTGWDNISQ